MLIRKKKCISKSHKKSSQWIHAQVIHLHGLWGNLIFANVTKWRHMLDDLTPVKECMRQKYSPGNDSIRGKEDILVFYMEKLILSQTCETPALVPAAFA